MKEEIKKKLVSYLGGECVVCGYKRCNAALHFHHLNPVEKEFNISTKNNLDSLKEEVEKCILVCSNCHAEIHKGLINHELLLTLAGID